MSQTGPRQVNAANIVAYTNTSHNTQTHTLCFRPMLAKTASRHTPASRHCLAPYPSVTSPSNPAITHHQSLESWGDCPARIYTSIYYHYGAEMQRRPLPPSTPTLPYLQLVDGGVGRLQLPRQMLHTLLRLSVRGGEGVVRSLQGGQ